MVRKNRLAVYKKYDGGGAIGPDNWSNSHPNISPLDPQRPGLIGPSDWMPGTPLRKRFVDNSPVRVQAPIGEIPAMAEPSRPLPAMQTLPEPQQPQPRQNVFSNAMSHASDIMPYVSNFINSTRRVPLPQQPDTVSPISPAHVYYTAENAEADRQTRGANRSADRMLDENTAGAVRAGNLAQQIRAKNSINENEANTNSQLKMEADRTNAGIDAQNVAIRNGYKNAQTEAQIAQQRAESQNIANAADKYIGQQNVKSAQQLDMAKWDTMKTLYRRSGVADRTFGPDTVYAQNLKRDNPELYNTLFNQKAYGGKMKSRKPVFA